MKINQNFIKLKKYLVGTNSRMGLLIKVVVYTLLSIIGFVYVYPLLYMLVSSFMSLDDLLDSSIKWLPSALYIDNYTRALSVLNIKKSLYGSIVLSIFPSLFQVSITALVGYGFARFDFKFKRILLFFMIFSLIVPPQVLMMPTYVLYQDLKLVGSAYVFLIPAALGQGIKSTIFILIYYQFFKQTPKALYEAAEVDGANEWTNFYKVGLPMAIPACIIVFLFSFVWYWNEVYLMNLYLTGNPKGTKWTTMLLNLQKFQQNYELIYPVKETGAMTINEGIVLAGTMITLIPLIITYICLQKYFTESVDRTGITGE
ncbi:carbohydrate ABC transporter permease [Tuanshanicoccus lijuaniae]|uniref:carbohydrate ABC transporter permease n=1 Tax=Aerococcaceae bacterium zg-1292 TaxID=2774330 RepID=UPI004064571A